ncbi:MAG: PAS domain S-box protein [Deltaproteobacteria bacterium]|jgi:PAS domain S-box-containing protein|nr:PAS domain S-box protein [Deltaproteobacteria bacterium]MBW2478787.1 PAS domain S-box protein [Deltaproteobacteria bacterium]
MADKPSREEMEQKIKDLEQAQFECKQAEAALRESEEKYKLLAENSADIIYKISVETEKCTYASPTVKRMLGYTVEEVLTLESQDILTPESYTKQKERLIKSLENNPHESEMLELEAIHKAGHSLPVQINANFLFDETGNPVEILGVARDISKQKKLREEREALIQNLQDALKEIKTLRGILPICSICSKVRDDKGYWEQVDVYIQKHSQADISHSICPECTKELYPNFDRDET